MMDLCLDMHRQGQLDKLYHVFAFLKKKHGSKIVFDPNEPNFGDDQFVKEDWNDKVYGECNE